MTGRNLRVAINLQLSPLSSSGGIVTISAALVHALGQLDGDEEFVIIGPSEGSEWLRPYLGPRQTLVFRPTPPRGKHRLLAPTAALVRRRLRRFLHLDGPLPWPQVPVSNGFYESLQVDVIHFPYQHFVVCALPTVYTPHDLQHRHYPAFFDAQTIAWRENTYRTGCALAQAVVAGSGWVKRDLIRQYGLSAEKVQVIPWAAPTDTPGAGRVQNTGQIREIYALPESFAFYPAASWPHKNHLRLLEAVATLRHEHNHQLDVVLTGARTDHWAAVEARAAELQISDQIHHLGLVPYEHLRPLYRAAQFVVLPTLFEAASGPMFEAWLEQCPVACSNVTSLPEQAQDAALIFDPLSIESIASALFRLATDTPFREQLRLRGVNRLQDFSWKRTAAAYCALYRKTAGRKLSEQDEQLLQYDWMSLKRSKEESE